MTNASICRVASTIVLAALWATNVISASVALAADPSTTLPLERFSDILVDSARQQVFISGGVTGDDVDDLVVVDFNGTVVETIDVPGAAGLVLHNDTVYVGRTEQAAITKIDAQTLSADGEIALDGPMNGDLELQDGRLWYTAGGCGNTSELGTVDIATENSTSWLEFASIFCGKLAAVPGDPSALLVSNSSWTRRLDISTTPPTLLPAKAEEERDIRILAGGESFVGFAMREFDTETLDATGFKYEGSLWPLAAGGGGLVAGHGSAPADGSNVNVYDAGNPTPSLVFPFAGLPLDGEFDSTGATLFVVGEVNVFDLKVQIFDLSKENLDLELDASSSAVDYGEKYTLTAQLERPVDLTNTSVTLYQAPAGNGWEEIETKQVDAAGGAVFEIEAEASSRFHLAFDGDDGYIGGTSNLVDVGVRTIAKTRLRGNYGEQKGIKLFHAGDPVKILGRAAPSSTVNGCSFVFYVQRYVPADDKWRYVTSSVRCQDEEGRASWRPTLEREGAYRVRTSFRFIHYLPGYSEWRYLEVTA